MQLLNNDIVNLNLKYFDSFNMRLALMRVIKKFIIR